MAVAAAQIIADLGLRAHPEGGYFREAYRAAEEVRTPRGPRSAATAILFLVTAATPSRFHRLLSAEIWLHQGGAPLELIMLSRREGLQAVTLESVGAEDVPAPELTWQAARVVSDPTASDSVAAGTGADGDPGAAEDWSLVSCVVAPGFDYEDFELARRDDLLSGWPAARELILALT
jgi:hypothetical protein